MLFSCLGEHISFFKTVNFVVDYQPLSTSTVAGLGIDDDRMLTVQYLTRSLTKLLPLACIT